MRKNQITFVIVLFFLTAIPDAFAQDLAGMRVRADDVNLWHFRDNPALLGFRTQPFMVGAAYSTVDGLGTPAPFDLVSGTWSFGIITPLVNYINASAGALQTNWLGSAVPLGRVFSFGYAYSWREVASPSLAWCCARLISPRSAPPWRWTGGAPPWSGASGWPCGRWCSAGPGPRC
jgi:hypothetical protein